MGYVCGEKGEVSSLKIECVFPYQYSWVQGVGYRNLRREKYDSSMSLSQTTLWTFTLDARTAQRREDKRKKKKMAATLIISEPRCVTRHSNSATPNEHTCMSGVRKRTQRNQARINTIKNLDERKATERSSF